MPRVAPLGVVALGPPLLLDTTSPQTRWKPFKAHPLRDGRDGLSPAAPHGWGTQVAHAQALYLNITATRHRHLCPWLDGKMTKCQE